MLQPTRCPANAALKQDLPAPFKRLSRMNEEARKAASSAETSLEQAYVLTGEAQARTRLPSGKLEPDPRELEKKEERLYALRDAARKYNVFPDALPRLLADFQAKRGRSNPAAKKLRPLKPP